MQTTLEHAYFPDLHDLFDSGIMFGVLQLTSISHCSALLLHLPAVPQSDPFELFISATDIRYCYYSETQKILGNTYGMLVLQDFEAVTPNLLARTIETVEGGGIVVVLMRTVKSLKQLYTMTMVGRCLCCPTRCINTTYPGSLSTSCRVGTCLPTCYLLPPPTPPPPAACAPSTVGFACPCCDVPHAILYSNVQTS